MKKSNLVLLVCSCLIMLGSCKALARTAAKYWTRKQIKEFVNNCETKAAKIIGEEKAKHYCDCAVDVAAEKYKNYDDIKDVSALELIKLARDCSQGTE